MAQLHMIKGLSLYVGFTTTIDPLQKIIVIKLFFWAYSKSLTNLGFETKSLKNMLSRATLVRLF